MADELMVNLTELEVTQPMPTAKPSITQRILSHATILPSPRLDPDI